MTLCQASVTSGDSDLHITVDAVDIVSIVLIILGMAVYRSRPEVTV